MKFAPIIFSLLISLSGLASTKELNFKEPVKVRKVVMKEILIKDLSSLYSEFHFEDRMIASEKKVAEEK